MKQLNFVYVDPGGNPTILVLDTVPRPAYPAVANRLMKNQKFPCEQVGFVRPAKTKQAVARLEMMGGEFCGNALRSLGAYLASQIDGKSTKNSQRFLLESSGTNALIPVEVIADKQGRAVYSSTEIPLPKREKLIRPLPVIIDDKYQIEGLCVDLSGISHIILPYRFFRPDLDFKKIFAGLYRTGQLKQGAAGLIFAKKIKRNNRTIQPIVYVKDTKSIVNETSCASGTVAVAITENKKTGAKKFTVMQPSGSRLEVNINGTKHAIRRITVGGKIITIQKNS